MSEPRDDGPPGTQDACCAHTRVSYRTREERSGLVVEGWWECDSGCSTRFVPSRVALPPPGSALQEWDGPVAKALRLALADAEAEVAALSGGSAPDAEQALEEAARRALDAYSGRDSRLVIQQGGAPLAEAMEALRAALRGAQPASRVPSPAEGEVSHVAACQCPECKEWRAQLAREMWSAWNHNTKEGTP